MSFSPDARHRARHFRDMTRDHNKTNRSITSDHGSIPDSTTSDFDPENEALMSTRQLDNTNTNHRLPELRASAKRFGRRNEPEPDFVIDTSAIGKAFPDFSMGGSSSEEADDSIEIGRGGKKAVRRSADAREFSSNAPFSNGNDSFRSSRAMIGSFEVLATPPARPRRSLGTQAESGSVRKDQQTKAMAVSQKENNPPGKDPSPPPAKTSDYISNGSKTTASRRTLAEIHARVTSEDDGSLLSDERPPSINIAARNTRFVNPRSRQTSDSSAGVSIPTKFINTENFLQNLAAGTSNRNAEKQQPTATLGTTQQSFLLPDLPNLSELVSGVFNDGTPVFSRPGKPRSRFVSAAQPNKADHVPIESIPVPAEERAIFVSLKLLQDKVAELENDKAEVEKRAEDLKSENDLLKAQRKEQEKRRRSDSALGMADSGSDALNGRRNNNWIVEKTKLESTVKSLQTRLDTATRKVSVSEITIKNLTQERDNAVSQLGVAYYSSEGLKTENDILRKENETLKVRIAQLESHLQNETQTWKKMEKSFRKQLERKEQSVREVNEMSRKIWELRDDLPAPWNGKEVQKQTNTDREDFCQQTPTNNVSERQTRSKSEAKKASMRGRREVVAGPTVCPDTANVRPRSVSRRRASAPVASEKVEQVQKKKRTRRIIVEQTINTDESDGEAPHEVTGVSGVSKMIDGETHRSQHTTHRGEADDESSDEVSTLGVLQLDQVERMRATVEAEHRERKERNAACNAATRDDHNETIQTEKSTRHPRPMLPRKSSMKDLAERTVSNRSQYEDATDRVGVKSGGEHLTDDETTHSKKSAVNRRNSEGLVVSKTTTRRRLSANGMTSAFILPDITIQGVPTKNGTQHLSESAQRVLHGLVNHNPNSCMVCCRISANDPTKTIGGQKVEETFTVPKPIPVSERMPQPGEWNEEPTVRPSQPPPIALATVIKGLNDELSHLKMKLHHYQVLYSTHDASLGKRRREWLNKKMKSLMELIEIKSNQVYALHDVLEGQKDAGHEMTQEEVEIELTNVGIDVTKLGLRGGELKQAKKNKVTYADYDMTGGSKNAEENSAYEDEFEDDDELPWEGIDDGDETDETES